MYKLAGTDSFRLSSSAIFEEYGSNLQNVEKSNRALYVADGLPEDIDSVSPKLVQFAESSFKDYSMFTDEELDTFYIQIQCDQSGADALIVSYLTKPAKFRSLFLNGIKPHVYIGLAFPEHWAEKYPQINSIRDLPVELIKKADGWKELETAIKDSDNNPPSSRYYYIYKQTCHSSNYDILAPTFRLNVLLKSGGKINMSKNDAEKYLENYHKQFPEIRTWQAEVRDILKKSRMLYTLQGYPITFTDVVDDSLFKVAYASVPQATVGIITHEAVTDMQHYIETSRKKWDILNNCHDSYLIQCPIREWQDCAKKAKEYMERPLTAPRGEKFNMRSEVQVGFNWAPAKNHPYSDDPKIINKYNLIGLREVKL